MKNLLIAIFALSMIQINAQELTFKNDRFYAENDQLYSGQYDELREDGSTKVSYTISYGQLHGEAKFYTKAGLLEEIGNYDKGKKHGKWERFDTSGTLVGEAYYLNGKKDGVWTIWNSNGQKTYHMVYEMGKRTDVWRMWDENGDLLSERTYD